MKTTNPESVEVIPPAGNPVADAFLAKLQERFPGIREAVETPARDILRDYTLHPPSMGFGQFGMKCHALGWPVMPQARTGRRLGSLVAGRALEWKGFQTKRPSTKDVVTWGVITPDENTAIVTGDNGVRIRGIDIDCGTEFWSGQIVTLAEKHFGKTPFHRQGRAPRWMLLYQESLHTPVEDTIRTRSLRFEERTADGKVTGSDDGLEILGPGRLITIYGRHHSTGGSFYWPILDGALHEPATHGPEHLPFIDKAKIDAFLKEVNELRPILNFARSTVSHFDREKVEYDPTLKIFTPPFRERIGTWSSRDGKATITDGRKDWVRDRTLMFVLHNAPHVRAGGTGLASVREKAIAEALRFIQRSGEWTQENYIVRYVVELFDRTARRFCEGEFRERIVSFGPDGKAYTKPEAILALEGTPDRDLAYIRPAKARRRSPTNVLAVTAPDAAVASKRALLDKTSRAALAVEISGRIDEVIRGFVNSLWDARDALATDSQHQAKIKATDDESEKLAIRRGALRALAMDMLEAIRLLKSPTGSGKTTRAVRIIRETVQTRGPLGAPIGFMLPSHQNISEVQGVAMEEANPEDIEAIWDEALKSASGLKTMAFKGKVLAGCHYSEQLVALYSANISASGMCRQRVKGVDGEWEDKVCPMASACGAMRQLALVEKADIIFLPHAYLTSPLPKQLKQGLAALFVDEGFIGQVLQTHFLPIEVLALPRKAPKLNIDEKKAGITELDLLKDREEACEVATRALIAGRCPAQTLYEYTNTNKDNAAVTYRGKALAQAAYDVCQRADNTGLDVKPGLSMTQVNAITAKPSGRDLWLERRFWSVVLERIQLLEADEAGRKAAALKCQTFDEVNRFAKHDRELAFQYRPQHDMPSGKPKPAPQMIKQDVVRISWQKKLNLANLPLFLLDASANEAILRMLYTGRELDVTVVDAPLHLRTVLIPETGSDQSLLPNARHRDPESRVRAAERQAKVKAVANRLALMNSHSHLLVASTKPVRADLMRGGSLDNIDFAHYGAMKGLDFAKRHAAIFCVGRMSSPVAVIDGYAAIFARLSPVAEMPYDEEGTGYVGGKELTAYQGERAVALRNGGTMTVRCAEYPADRPWHNAIAAQFREEEIRQAIGRLRPVYRDDATPPVAFVMSTCVPEGIIVDDVVNLDDLLSDDPTAVNLAEIMSRNAGVLDPFSGAIAAPDVSGRLGIEEAIGKLSHRELTCFTMANVWDNGATEPREVKLAPWISEHHAALLQSAHVAGRTLDRFEITDLKRVDSDVKAKPADKLDRSLSLLANADEASIEELRAERAARAIADAEDGLTRFGFGGIPLMKGSPIRMKLDVALIMARHGYLVLDDDPVPIETPLAA